MPRTRETLMPRYVITVVAILLFAAIAGVAYARDTLNATYQFAIQETCWEDTEGFAPDTLALLPLPPPGTPGVHFMRRVHNADFGTAQFNPDGTGLDGRLVSSLTSVGQAHFEGQHSCPFTYVLNEDDGSLDVTFGTCTFQNTFASQATGTITGIHTIGRLAQGRNVIVTSSSRPLEVETLNINVPNDGEFTVYRICTRAGTLNRISHD